MGHFTGHLHIIIGKNHGISDEDLEYFPESIPMMSIVDTFHAIPSHPMVGFYTQLFMVNHLKSTSVSA